MTIPAQRANVKLLESHSLPVRTHVQAGREQDLDPYTGKPRASPLARRALQQRHYLRKMPAWSKQRGTF